jgi:hypothetical protein
VNAEQHRLDQQRSGLADWQRWGPYLAERAWATLREDYSADGAAWDYFGHDQAGCAARQSRDAQVPKGHTGVLAQTRPPFAFNISRWIHERIA